MPFVADRIDGNIAARFAAQGVLITSLLFTLELAVKHSREGARLRRQHFAVLFGVKTVLATVLTVAAFGVGGIVLFPTRFDDPAWLGLLAQDTVFALLVALCLQEMILVRDLVGGRVLLNVLLGRYHRPRTEERIFLVLDVEGSTALAERLGGEGVHALLLALFADVAEETERHGGETHAYIGDQVIVTWTLRPGQADPRSLLCCVAIEQRVGARACAYRASFGHVPDFRIGLQGGPVVAGECDGDRRQIVYFGDTINTAVRLQEACKALSVRLLVSAELLQRLDVPPMWRFVDVGELTLRGRARPIRAMTMADRLPTS